MKNQFVGDINDYYKYGLLRMLAGFGEKKLGVCWMLTPDRTEYLDDPRKWRKFDPELFDKLRRIVRARSVRRIEKAGILCRARFYREPFKAGSRHRGKYFDEMLGKFAATYLVFFDPDVGLAPSAGKYRNKWLQVNELGRAFEEGHSVLVIQFPRREKADWIGRQVKRIWKATQAAKIYTFHTPRVAFFWPRNKGMLGSFVAEAKKSRNAGEASSP